MAQAEKHFRTVRYAEQLRSWQSRGRMLGSERRLRVDTSIFPILLGEDIEMLDKLSPALNALLAIPAMIIVSLPLVYISGTLAIIATDEIAIGIGTGITVGVLFALWAGYGIYHLSNEVRDEPGADSVTA